MLRVVDANNRSYNQGLRPGEEHFPGLLFPQTDTRPLELHPVFAHLYLTLIVLMSSLSITT